MILNLGKRMTVLIVEDNSGVRTLLRRALLGTASRVWECSDGADALQSYTDFHPDVVLMDIRMPRMDGLLATRQIRQSDPLAKVVMVTDYDDEDLRRAASAAGACGYTLKQDLSELVELLRSLEPGEGGPSTLSLH
jgi:CheY-like chemotaxis protein